MGTLPVWLNNPFANNVPTERSDIPPSVKQKSSKNKVDIKAVNIKAVKIEDPPTPNGSSFDSQVKSVMAWCAALLQKYKDNGLSPYQLGRKLAIAIAVKVGEDKEIKVNEVYSEAFRRMCIPLEVSEGIRRGLNNLYGLPPAQYPPGRGISPSITPENDGDGGNDNSSPVTGIGGTGLPPAEFDPRTR